MRNIAVLVVALAGGCSFTPPIPADDQSSDDPGPDASVSSDGDTTTTPGPARCGVSDGNLKLCLEFDDDVDPMRVARDGSGKGHDAEASFVNRMTRADAPGYAAILSTVSRLHVGETADLDIKDNLTVEMWIAPAGIASGQRYYLLDNDDQYSMSYDDRRDITCAIAGVNVESQASVGQGAFHHVACTYDRNELRVYVDGDLSGCREETQAIPITRTDGTAIGANLEGAAVSQSYNGQLDGVRIYDRTLSSSELCSRAGKSGCNDSCPSSGEQGGRR